MSWFRRTSLAGKDERGRGEGHRHQVRMQIGKQDSEGRKLVDRSRHDPGRWPVDIRRPGGMVQRRVPDARNDIAEPAERSEDADRSSGIPKLTPANSLRQIEVADHGDEERSEQCTERDSPGRCFSFAANPGNERGGGRPDIEAEQREDAGNGQVIGDLGHDPGQSGSARPTARSQSSSNACSRRRTRGRRAGTTSLLRTALK